MAAKIDIDVLKEFIDELKANPTPLYSDDFLFLRKYIEDDCAGVLPPRPEPEHPKKKKTHAAEPVQPEPEPVHETETEEMNVEEPEQVDEDQDVMKPEADIVQVVQVDMAVVCRCLIHQIV